MAISPQNDQQYPQAGQAGQFLYLNMLQSSVNNNQEGYTMKNTLSGMPTCMSPQLFPETQMQSPMQSSLLPNSDILNKIISRSECIDSKLVRLDKIEKSVSEISSKVEKMDDKLVSPESKWESIKRSRQFDSQTMADLNKKHSDMQKDLTDTKKTNYSGG